MRRVIPCKAHAAAGRLSIQGQFLRRSRHREVAIYLRDGAIWIADFVDGHGCVTDPYSWLRFNCGAPSNADATRRTLQESAEPLSAEVARRIERLHLAFAAAWPDSARALPLRAPAAVEELHGTAALLEGQEE